MDQKDECNNESKENGSSTTDPFLKTQGHGYKKSLGSKEADLDQDLDLDTALGRVGGYRWYNLCAFFLLGISSFASYCWQSLGVIFMGKYNDDFCVNIC